MAMQSLAHKCLGKYLISTLGEDGIAAAAARMNGVAGEVAEAVQKWESGGEITAFVEVIAGAVDVVDSYDLRYKEIPLRSDLEKFSGVGGLWDPAPRSCILNALIESAEPGEKTIEWILSQIASYRTPRLKARTEFNAALALAMRLNEQGRFDDAIAILEGNFAVWGLCAASQYQAFQAYAGKEARGEKIANKRVTTDDFSRKFCPAPFETLSTVPWKRLTGKPIFYACGCSRFLPYPISATDEVVDLEEEWNGAPIQELRRSILDGDFKYCSRGGCGFLLSGNLPNKEDVTDPIMRDVIDNHKTFMDQPPRVLLLSHDASCNIACPSCRPGIITSKNAEREAMDAFADRVLVPFLANAGNGQITLDICGDGDPFGSKHYRRLIHSLDPERHKHVRLRLTTNGLLLTKKEWEELGPVRDMILEIKVSIDAAAAPTYEYVRRPGKWAALVENMEHLAQVLEKEPYKFYFTLNFVVQKANYREMPDIVRLAKSWNARRVLFQRIYNFGTYAGDDFLSHDVFDPRHPDHADFLRVLSDPVLRDPIVDLWQLATYVKESDGRDVNGHASPEADIAGRKLEDKANSAPPDARSAKATGLSEGPSNAVQALSNRAAGSNIIDHHPGADIASVPSLADAPRLPLHFFSHHKCATRWLKDYLSEFCSLNEIAFFHADKGSAALRTSGATFLGNASYRKVTNNSSRGCHIIRNPMSIVCSAYFSHARTHPTASWPQLLHQRYLLSQCTTEEGLFLTLAFLESERFGAHSAGPLNGLATWNYDDERYKTIRMEDLVLRPSEIFATILEHFGLNGSYLKLPDEARFAFAQYAGGRKPGSTDFNSHYRSGDPDEWRLLLPPPIVAYVRHHFFQLLNRFYPESLLDPAEEARPAAFSLAPKQVLDIWEESEGLYKERTELYRQREELYLERDELYRQREELYSERAELYKQREGLCAERNALQKQCEDLSRECLSLRKRLRS